MALAVFMYAESYLSSCPVRMGRGLCGKRLPIRWQTIAHSLAIDCPFVSDRLPIRLATIAHSFTNTCACVYKHVRSSL